MASPISNTSTSLIMQEIAPQAAAPLPIDLLAHEVFVEICKYFTPKDLARLSCVSKTINWHISDPHVWNDFDLTKEFPQLTIIDGAAWDRFVDLEKHGLDITGAPPISKRTKIRDLTRLFKRLKLEVNAGLTLLTLPKGLTFRKLMVIATEPKEGIATRFEYIRPEDFNELADISIAETCEVAITNSILTESRYESALMRQAHVEDLGCEVPGVLPGATLAILTQIMRGVRLFGDQTGVEGRWTYSLTSDQIGDDFLAFGRFAPDGLYICYDAFDNDNYGVGALWKFKPEEPGIILSWQA